MYESVFLTVAGVLAIGSAWVFLRPRLARSEDDLSPSARWREESELSSQSPTTMPTHRAVAVTPGAFCCKAVQQLEDQRYLSGDAPLLPLSECDQAACECTYEHHDDRRSDEDRRNTYAAYSGFDPMQDRNERRLETDRRER
jgi:hypothetical protein